MATPKKPSNRGKSGSTRSSAGKKKPATRASSKSGGKATRKAPAKAARKAPGKTARKTAPKSGSKAQARAAAAAVPDLDNHAKTAAAARAEATTPSLRPGRRRSWSRWAAVAGLLAAAVVVIVLISTGGDDDNATVADNAPATTPTTAIPTATAPALTTPPAAAPATAKPVVRTDRCDPIVGSGTANSGRTYDVTSSAKDGDPADCGEAHDVLLSALQGSGTTVGDWTCKTDPSGDPIASCNSGGGRSIQASG